MSRYRADEARIWLWDAYERTCLKWRSSDYWDDIRLSLKAYFPRHGDLSYSATRKLWSVPVWRRPSLEEWLCWTFEPTAIMWDQEPAGAYGRTYSRSDYGQYRRPQASTSGVDGAYAELCLTAEAPAELVKTVHHWWIRQVHPDTGHGDTARMARINAAVDTIREDRQRKAS
jgi:hypothetical protein